MEVSRTIELDNSIDVGDFWPKSINNDIERRMEVSRAIELDNSVDVGKC